MKKVVSLVLALLMALSLVSCGDDKDTTVSPSDSGNVSAEPSAEPSEEPSPSPSPETYALGETVSTDIVEFTLNEGQLAIALNNTINDSYFLPKEYDATSDARNPFVAAKGHTLVAFTFTVKNTDRASFSIGGTFDAKFIDVEYDGKTYSGETDFGYVSYNLGETWEKYDVGNILLSAGECRTLRSYVDISVDAADLKDDFILNVYLPTSGGQTEQFSYLVTEEGRQKLIDDAAAAQKAEEAWQAKYGPIDEALQGSWVHEDTTITFEAGRFTYDYIRVSDGEREVNHGDYVINDSTITLAYDSGHAPEIDYEFSDGVLTLIGEMGSGERYNYEKQ